MAGRTTPRVRPTPPTFEVVPLLVPAIIKPGLRRFMQFIRVFTVAAVIRPLFMENLPRGSAFKLVRGRAPLAMVIPVLGLFVVCLQPACIKV